ncbi:glycoside hydrolase family 88 protein [Pelagibacterium sp. 26DY04]|uniref:glycoside hydrolase family 88/105 protein n=1 Tax=Pelagibacterium sp. 26DY04 TaxID=2967130 RepID=UPI00281531C4|nr:glycoside hydrolase family 88 protein [Pelagibacterium sp. 26DY04]WMT85919.1 glycoside hydrolase family 88 protein [Pelagibacterium sp. 26DY04]
MKLDTFFDTFAEQYQHYKRGDWCYEDGCVYRGLLLLDGVDPRGPWFGHLKRLVDSQVGYDGSLAGYDIEEFNIDNILSGRALIALYARTGEEKYRLAADRLAEQLGRHPRIGRGNYWHKLRYPHQVWLDGLYMGLPFQIEYGKAFGKPELVDDAIVQLKSALELLADPATGLYSHGYDEAREQRWADKRTGRSQALWSRALGWLAMALVDVHEAIGPKLAAQAGLDEAIEVFAKRVARHQREDGRWNQVTDQPELEGNYPESSATAMFAYFFLVGERLGISGVDGEIGLKALAGLREHALAVGPDGEPVLGAICHVAGLGGFDGRYRDGTAAYYVSERLQPNDAKGVGPFMMAVAEARRRERLGEASATENAGFPASARAGAPRG